MDAGADVGRSQTSIERLVRSAEKAVRRAVYEKSNVPSGRNHRFYVKFHAGPAASRTPAPGSQVYVLVA